MEEPPQADVWTSALGISTAVAFAQLCEMLAGKGILEAAEIDALRRSALGGFDEVRERQGLSPDLLHALVAAGKNLELLWPKATAIAGAGLPVDPDAQAGSPL